MGILPKQPGASKADTRTAAKSTLLFWDSREPGGIPVNPGGEGGQEGKTEGIGKEEWGARSSQLPSFLITEAVHLNERGKHEGKNPKITTSNFW